MHDNVAFAKKMPFTAHQFTAFSSLNKPTADYLTQDDIQAFSRSLALQRGSGLSLDLHLTLCHFLLLSELPQAPITCQSLSSPKAFTRAAPFA